MASAPTGTISFLFTDVQGSTELWERDQDWMSAALTEHDRAIRAAVAQCDGHIFSTAGDSFAVAFSRPQDAVAAAVAAQTNLASVSEGALLVRMGLHAGVAEERDDNYFGPTVNTCARVMGCAHGGQIVASAAFGELLSGGVPDDIVLRHLGRFQLRDVADGIPLVQVVTPALRQDFPSLRGAVALTDLPTAVTPFIGRERDLADVAERLITHRLVSIVGPGGAGKTRLAMQVATTFDAARDGAVFVSFDSAAASSDPVDIVASRLNATGEEGVANVESIIRHLGGKSTLLVLDNCEHLADSIAAMTERLLAALPSLLVLATSREPLGLAGESVASLTSMTLPPRDAVSIDAVVSSDAGRLLVDRVNDTQRAEPLRDSDAADLAAICHGVDGLPLALELVGSNAGVLSVRQIAEHLDGALDLRGAGRSSDTRRSTLRATIEWSHELLQEPEQALLRRLSIFPASFDIESAAAVTGASSAIAVLGDLSSLVNKSLLISMTDAGAARYRMLRTVRSFAAELLDEAAERAELADRHAHHFAMVVAEATGDLEGPRQISAVHALAADYANITGAIDHYLTTGQGEAALEVAVALGPFWDTMHWLSESEHWLGRSLDAAGPDAERRLEGLIWYGDLLEPSNQNASRVAMEEAAEIARRAGDEVAEARALLGLERTIRRGVSTLESQRLLDRAVKLFERHGDTQGLARAFQASGAYEPDDTAAIDVLLRGLDIFEREQNAFRSANTLYFLGRRARRADRLDDAERWLERALTTTAEFTRSHERSHARSELGHVARLRGYHDRARAIFEECLDRFREAGDARCEARMLGGLGSLAAREGDEATALPMLERSIRMSLRVGAPENLILCLDGLAAMASGEQAARLIGLARATRARLALKLSVRDEELHARHATRVLEEIGAEAFAAAEAVGNGSTPEDALSGRLGYS